MPVEPVVSHHARDLRFSQEARYSGQVPSTSERVRDLIGRSGHSQHEFASEIGLDDSKLSKSLSGARRFSSLDLARIADLCGVTVDWLITGDEPEIVMAARSTGGSAQAAIRAATRFSTIRTDLASLGYPQPWRAAAAAPGTGRLVDQGTRLARGALDRVESAGQSPTQEDLAAVVETVFGADVGVVELSAGFDGLAVSSDAVKLIVLAASLVPARQRFTLAHELGHLLAGDDHGVHLDSDVFDPEQRRDPSEMRANAFAAAFLMPEDVLRDAVGTTGLTETGFAELACRLMVSPSTLAYRLLTLRLVDNGSADRFKSMTGATAASLSGRNDEWARLVARSSAPQPPGLLGRDAYAAYHSGVTTLRPYANLLGVDVDKLRVALEAESGVLDVS